MREVLHACPCPAMLPSHVPRTSGAVALVPPLVLGEVVLWVGVGVTVRWGWGYQYLACGLSGRSPNSRVSATEIGLNRRAHRRAVVGHKPRGLLRDPAGYLPEAARRPGLGSIELHQALTRRQLLGQNQARVPHVCRFLARLVRAVADRDTEGLG